MKDKNIKYLIPGFVSQKCNKINIISVFKSVPFVLVPLFSSCQSNPKIHNGNLSILPEISQFKNPGNESTSSQLEKDIAAEQDMYQAPIIEPELQNEDLLSESPEENSDLSGQIAPEELQVEENLTLKAPDELFISDTAKEFSSELSFAEDSSLLCEDSAYYKSWKRQFDSAWLKENSKKYKKLTNRNRALAQARTNRFIQIVYPSIEKTGFDFPVVINSRVLQWINYFKGAGRNTFVVWLRRSQAHIPKMQKTLETYGLPRDIVYLSMIESGFSTKALSYAGAVGPWQFMPGTAKEYGLKINDYVDERRDFNKSTHAAANYLTNLYTMFGSWHLAAASYNGGPGLIQRTLRSHGEDSSFFDLTTKGVVNRETANYVPKIIAAMIIAKNPEKFGFDSVQKFSAPEPTKKITLTRSISLADLAESIKVDKSVLEELNPELRIGITPPAEATSTGQFELKVPASTFDLALASIDLLPKAPTQMMVTARIKRRETLASFASRYRLKTSTVLSANANLKANSRLNRGQVVYIPVALGTGQYSKLSAMKYSKPNRLVKRGKKKSFIAKRGAYKRSLSKTNKSHLKKAPTHLKKKIKKVATSQQKKKQPAPTR